jgi:DNA-binding NarL/FixJ family response regulator
MSTVPRRASVLIADDHPLMSQGLRALLRPNFVVVGVVNDGREVHTVADSTKPDILLLDLSMPHRNGIELIPELIAAFPAMKILVVTMHVDRALCDLAMQAGAHGFVPKESSADELNHAIQEVLDGRRYVSPKVPRRSFRDGVAVEHPELDRLTPRHLQILRLIGDGKATAEIAEALGVSPRTVEFHRASIRKALGITSEYGLMRFAIMLQVGGDDESGGGAADVPGGSGGGDVQPTA